MWVMAREGLMTRRTLAAGRMSAVCTLSSICLCSCRKCAALRPLLHYFYHCSLPTPRSCRQRLSRPFESLYPRLVLQSKSYS
ncbi:MAG: hypothetical protein J3R72DRAFT_454606 [Linnemannia gamsii]|nr:MAG: hypothetical protein J3R72DRAFT_454606 [Linnemannia gamsii]